MRPPTSEPLRRPLAVTAAALVAVLAQAGTAHADTSAVASTASTTSVGAASRVVTTADGESFHLKLAATPVILPADGATVRVAGHGYNTKQGILLAFCVIPDEVEVGDPSTYTALPTPCLGGKRSTDGSARRITNDATGTPGVTIPYQKGGSFFTTLNLKPQLADGPVCDVTVRCAIVTRSDMTATGDRSYDQYIPVHFSGTS